MMHNACAIRVVVTIASLTWETRVHILPEAYRQFRFMPIADSHTYSSQKSQQQVYKHKLLMGLTTANTNVRL